MRSVSRQRQVLSLAFFAALLVILLGCQSTPESFTVIESADEAAFEELDDIELMLVEYQASTDESLLADAERELTALAAVERRNDRYSGRLLSLEAELARLRGRQQHAASLAAQALELAPNDEIALLVSASLAETLEAELAMLEEAIRRADSTRRLQAREGAVLLGLRRIGAALASFDEALAALPEEYQALYGEQRERAWALRESESLATASQEFLTNDELPLEGMAVLTQSESSLLDFLTGGRVWEPSRLYAAMIEAELLLPDAPAPTATTLRRDAAYLLWKLHVLEMGQGELLTRYSDRLSGPRGARSPVPDVEIDDAWFDAVLGLVEREIMELPDGRRFFPGESVTGLEFYARLQATEQF
ncbi:MAG: hypothetical protein ACLFP4_11295 [Spirochaetales bacterium]